MALRFQAFKASFWSHCEAQVSFIMKECCKINCPWPSHWVGNGEWAYSLCRTSLICQVTKCAVTGAGICQLCPHGPLSWTTFQRTDQAHLPYLDTEIPFQKDHHWIWTLAWNLQQPKGGGFAWQRRFLSFSPTGSVWGAPCPLLGTMKNGQSQELTTGPAGKASHLSAYLLPSFHLCILVGASKPFKLPWPILLWAGRPLQVLT